MYTERIITRVEEIEGLLHDCGLTMDVRPEYTMGLFDGQTLIATGSVHDRIARMIAVSPDHQGEDLSARVTTNLINYAFGAGIQPLFLFTKPDKADMFRSMGFRCVAEAPRYSVLMEFGCPGIREYLEELCRLAGPRGTGTTGALVMNCNPFTLGHRYLVETAAAACDKICLFVVEEDRSEFPFAHRLRLVRAGVAHLKNVVVIPGGRYIISGITFPSYFTKEEAVADAHSSLDAAIFAGRIAPALGISKRFFGEEPFSPVTERYNQAMGRILPPAGVEVVVIPRKTKDGTAISASAVRAHLARGNLEAAEALVPPTTMEYLRSEEAAPVLDKIRANHQKAVQT